MEKRKVFYIMNCEKASDMVIDEIYSSLPRSKRVIVSHISSFLCDAAVELVAEQYFKDRSLVIDMENIETEEQLLATADFESFIKSAMFNKSEQYVIVLKNLKLDFLFDIARNHGYKYISKIRKQKGIPQNVFVLSSYCYSSLSELFEIGCSGIATSVYNLESLFRRQFQSNLIA